MTVASCPSCQESVTVPVDATADCVVRCPLCNEEFTLEAFLRQLPPTLIVLDRGSGIDSGVALSIGSGIDAHDGSESSTDLEASSSNVLGPLVVSGTTTDVASDSVPAFDFTPGSADEEGGGSAQGSPRRVPRQQKNPTIELVKIVGGALLAIPLAQIILWWLVPVSWKRDPFHLGPAVSRVVPWVVPAQFSDPTTGVVEESSSIGTQSQDTSPLKHRRARSRATSGSAMPQPGSGHATPKTSAKPAVDKVAPNTAPKRPKRPKQSKQAVTPNDKAATGDAHSADQPAAPATDAPTTVVVRGVRGAPQYSAEEIHAALEAAVQASVAWDTNEDQSETHRKQLNEQFYYAFARLSESVTYPPPNDPETGELVSALSDMLGTFVKEPKKLAMIGNQAAAWLEQSTRPHHGIFIFGTVKRIKTAGTLYETELELAARKKRVLTVVSRVDPRNTFAPGDRILMLGAIVDQPKRNLLGYEGNEPIVVMGGFPVLLR